MRALHSSSALVCNLFDYWIVEDPTAIGRCFGLNANAHDIQLEVELPTGFRGTPPTPDVLIIDRSSMATVVESKFTEPFWSKRHRPPFEESYFNDSNGTWARLGLPKCQALAERLQREAGLFSYLDAPQLLKHAIGLNRAYPTGRLTLLWFDPCHTEGTAYHKEIQMFGELVNLELGFNALTHQTVFKRLKSEAHTDPDYVEYLESRYFSI